jgi:predicted transcriptional regulator
MGTLPSGTQYNEGRSTQIPLNPVVRVKGRFSRRLRDGKRELVVARWPVFPMARCAKVASVILKGRSRTMEVQFTPEVQAKLDQMARDAGRQPAEVIEDAVVGLYDELAFTREMLDRRYDEMESGTAQGIDGEEAYRLLMEKTQARRQRPA